MFKPLIKKVREGSANSSILPENNSDGLNENLNNENKSSVHDETTLSSHRHRQ